MVNVSDSAGQWGTQLLSAPSEYTSESYLECLGKHSAPFLPRYGVKRDNEDDDIPFNGIPIYLSDDLTKARAKLAYEARVTKRKGLIKGTWVTNGKIIVMDLSNHIKEVKCLNDLEKMKSRR